MTSCGDANEKTSAFTHAVVAVLYVVMLIFHGMAVFEHWGRHKAGD